MAKQSLIEKMESHKQGRDDKGHFTAKELVAEMVGAKNVSFGTGVAGIERRDRERRKEGMRQVVRGRSQKAHWTRKVREGMSHRVDTYLTADPRATVRTETGEVLNRKEAMLGRSKQGDLPETAMIGKVNSSR